MTATTDAASALAPVRGWLLRDARAEADRMVAEALDQAAATLDRARAEAERAVALAVAAGKAEAAQFAAAERARGHEQARSLLLSARREAYDELCGEVLAAAARLRDEPGYQRLIRRLATMAANAAGPEAAITVAPGGGVVARSPHVIVDCSLPRLARLAVEALGDQVRELWTS
jgi:hypothetical protein